MSVSMISAASTPLSCFRPTRTPRSSRSAWDTRTFLSPWKRIATRYYRCRSTLPKTLLVSCAHLLCQNRPIERYSQSVKYYYREHLSGYQRVEREGKNSWGEIQGPPDGFERFSSRPFLEQLLPQLEFDSKLPLALELGCGTGPGACFLAERGFRVHAVDLIPTAIDIARRIAVERNLDIHY